MAGDFRHLSPSPAAPGRRRGKILVGANNVFDKKPRINYNAASGFGGNSSSSAVLPDLPIDRFVYVRYNQNF